MRAILEWTYRHWVMVLTLADLQTRGAPSFSKLLCLTFAIVLIVRDQLTLGPLIALLAASFGRSVFLSFLSRTTIAARSQETRTDDERRMETE